jgi:hypothetical protein
LLAVHTGTVSVRDLGVSTVMLMGWKLLTA